MELQPVHPPGAGLLVAGLLCAGVGVAVAVAAARRRAAGLQGMGTGDSGGGDEAHGGRQLVPVKGYRGQALRLRADAAQALAALQEAARGAGFAPPLFQPVSGYRSRMQQENLWKLGLAKHGPEKVATYVAHPGSSAHETGRAVDLHLGFGIDSDNELKIKATDAYRWLAANGERFGWFPYKNEAWHWEFGAPHDATGATYRAEIAQGENEGWLR